MMLAEMEYAARVLKAAPSAPPPALVLYGTEEFRHQLEHYGYWAAGETAEEFERAAGERLASIQSRRWVFGTRMIVVEDADRVAMRRLDPDLPIQAGEEEVLWLVAVDLDEGIETGRVVVRGDTFGPLELMVGQTQTLEGAPGFTLLQTVLGGAA